MSKVLPYNAHNYCDENDQTNEICPRYQKWIKRITSFEHHHNNRRQVPAKFRSISSQSHPRYRISLFSKHPKGKQRALRRSECNEPIVTKKIYNQSNASSFSKPKEIKRLRRANTIFVQIRQKSRNFGIRCKTSVDLWRQWIKRGIRWDRHSSKSADIDIASLKTNLKDFQKKNIVNEVILEEEEIEERDTNSSGSSKEKIKRTKSKQNKNSTVHGKENDDTVHLKSALRHNRHNRSEGNRSDQSRIMHSADVDDTDVALKSDNKQSSNLAQTNDTTRKYPIQDLASLDIDKIEKLSLNDQQLQQDNRRCKDTPSSDIKPRGSIRRAFNKLKLFF